MSIDFKQLEKDLWSAADNLRANSDLTSQQYSTPVLGLIFLKYADNRFTFLFIDLNKKVKSYPLGANNIWSIQHASKSISE